MSTRPSVRRLLATVTTASAAAVLGGLAFAAPAAAHIASAQPLAASAYDFGPGRAGSSAAAFLALAGVVVGWLALARPTGRLGVASGPLGARIALFAGLVGTAVGVLVAATADGGLGTGNGLGGAFVAILVGVASTVLGWRATARVRRGA